MIVNIKTTCAESHAHYRALLISAQRAECIGCTRACGVFDHELLDAFCTRAEQARNISLLTEEHNCTCERANRQNDHTQARQPVASTLKACNQPDPRDTQLSASHKKKR